MKTIWGIFHTFRQADAAVVALQARGYTAGTIHALAPEAPVRQAPSGPTPSGLAGLLAGSRARDIKGMGKVLATGTLGRALARASAANREDPDQGLEEALMVAGLSSGYARLYLQGLQHRNTLLVVEADDAQERDVVNVLRRFEVEMLAGLPIAMPGEADFEQAVRREDEARAASARQAPEKDASQAHAGSARPAPQRHSDQGAPARRGDAHPTARREPPRPQGRPGGQAGNRPRSGATPPRQPKPKK